MLKVDRLNQYYGEGHTLRDATLDVPAGGCTCLMGRNGVGKTTLLKAIMGLLPVRSGSIAFAGSELVGTPADRRAKLGIGYVPQGREIFAQLTVEENLLVGLSARGVRHVPESVYRVFPVLKTMLRRRGGDLSGGQQQQLAIGRALALRPKLLILDEPTEGIQPNIVHEIGDTLLRLVDQEKMTILLVEQKLPFARRVGQRFVMLERGSTVAAGTMGDLDDALVRRHLNV